MTKIILSSLIFLLYSIVIFLIGFSYGNTRATNKNIDKELLASENLLKAQGDKPETIKATLEMIKIDRLNQFGRTKRQILSIWLPSILVAINIILTILLKHAR